MKKSYKAPELLYFEVISSATLATTLSGDPFIDETSKPPIWDEWPPHE